MKSDVEQPLSKTNIAHPPVSTAETPSTRHKSVVTGTKVLHRSRVLIADDHTLVAEACKKLLQPEFAVVEIVSDGRELLRACAAFKPDVVVTDIAMHSLNGLDAGERAKLSDPDLRVIYLTMFPDPDLAAEALRRGASAYLLKTSAASELVAAVKEVLSGRLYVSPAITQDSLSEFLRTHPREHGKTLTPRQREVLQLLAEGRSMKEAASVLNLTTRTVAFHKYRIMSALGIHTNADLIQYAIRNFIIAR